MKQSICQHCWNYIKVEDPIFPHKEYCYKFNQDLKGQTITQCRHFKEAEE